MRYPTFPFLISTLAVLAAACSPAPASPASTPISSIPTLAVAAYPTPEGTYPEPVSAYPRPNPENPAYPVPAIPAIAYPEPAYPWPVSPEQGVQGASIPVPEAAPDSAVIVGRLLENGKPLAYTTLFLADVLEDDSGEFQVASYSRESSLRAEVDGNGQFVFSAIKPGKYSLIVDNFATYFVLNIPESEEEKPLILEAAAGEVLDLGDLDYEDLPPM